MASLSCSENFADDHAQGATRSKIEEETWPQPFVGHILSLCLSAAGWFQTGVHCNHWLKVSNTDPGCNTLHALTARSLRGRWNIRRNWLFFSHYLDCFSYND